MSERERTSEIADRVRDELERARLSSETILAQAREEARRYETEAQREADTVIERRIARLRELRATVAERGEQVDRLLREYAAALNARANAALWQAAIAGRGERGERAREGRENNHLVSGAS